jgi:hypothetical protein
MAVCWIILVVSSEMSELPRNARETVVWDTPASFAMSLIDTGIQLSFAHVCIRDYSLFIRGINVNTLENTTCPISHDLGAWTALIVEKVIHSHWDNLQG